MFNCGDNSGGNVAGAYSSSVWGIIIFLLILFWVFGSNRNGFGGWGNNFGLGGGMGCGGWGGNLPFGLGTCNNNEHTPKDNDQRLADIKATMDKDTAVLTGQLETAFREVINVSNANTARVIESQKDDYIRRLERENTQLYINGQNDQLRNQMTIMGGQLNGRLDMINAEMLHRPPVYPTTCVPCSSNCCGNNDGCGCGCNG